METDLPPNDLANEPSADETPARRARPARPSGPPNPPPPSRRFGLFGRLLRIVVRLAAVALTAASAAAALGGWHWRLDYFANFPVQYLGLGVPVLVLLLVLRSWRMAGLFCGVLLWNVFLILPLLTGGPEPSAGDPAATLRVVQKNVWFGNENYGDTIAWMREQNADVIVVQEMNEAWRAELLSGLTLGGGFVAYEPKRPEFERHTVGVFVREGLEVASHRYWGAGEPRKPMVEVALNVPGFDLPVTLQGVHTRAPVRASWSWLRGKQLAELTGWAAGRNPLEDGPTLVVGDLNATRWSAPMRALMRHGGLRDTAEAGGPAALLGTWPDILNGPWPDSFSFAWTGMITLDHVLASGHFVVAQRTVGPGLGSDHRGVVVDLRRRKSP